MFKRIIAIALLATVLLAACVPAATPIPAEPTAVVVEPTALPVEPIVEPGPEPFKLT